MMMLIFDIVVIYSYLYSVCLLSRVLKKKHTSRNNFQWLLPNTAYVIRKTILNLNYVQYLNIAGNGNGMVYGPNETYPYNL